MSSSLQVDNSIFGVTIESSFHSHSDTKGARRSMSPVLVGLSRATAAVVPAHDFSNLVYEVFRVELTLRPAIGHCTAPLARIRSQYR